MTPTQAVQRARETYNAVGDTYWSDAELVNYLYAACLEINREGLILEKTFETTTVASQREYDRPTNCIQIKRMTYNGEKVYPIDFDEWDQITANDAASTDEGTPQYYLEWEEKILLEPIPDAAQTLKIRCINEPAEFTINGSFELESQWHQALVDYCVWRMTIKDSNNPMADRFREVWELHKRDARRWRQKKRRGDRFKGVKNEEAFSYDALGRV